MGLRPLALHIDKTHCTARCALTVKSEGHQAGQRGNAIEGLRCASNMADPDLATVDVHDDPEVTAEACLGLGLIEATWAPSGVAARGLLADALGFM